MNTFVDFIRVWKSIAFSKKHYAYLLGICTILCTCNQERVCWYWTTTKKHINSTEWCYWKISNYRFFCLAALKGFGPHFWCCRFNCRTNCRLKMKQQQMSMVHLQIQAIINSNQLCHSSNVLVWNNAPVFFLSLLFPLQTSFI